MTPSCTCHHHHVHVGILIRYASDSLIVSDAMVTVKQVSDDDGTADLLGKTALNELHISLNTFIYSRKPARGTCN